MARDDEKSTTAGKKEEKAVGNGVADKGKKPVTGEKDKDGKPVNGKADAAQEGWLHAHLMD